jgi:hypothetical protein
MAEKMHNGVDMDTSVNRVDTVGDEIRRAATIRTNALMRDFAMMLSDSRKRIPENIFRRHFVAFFSGVKSAYDAELLEHWYKIAGTPYEEVDLVDERGNVVATVPPVLDRDSIPIVATRQPGMSVDFALDNEAQQATLSPRLATTRLATTLTEKFVNPSEGRKAALSQRWEELLKRYEADIPKEKKTSSESDNSTSDFDYDL